MKKILFCVFCFAVLLGACRNAKAPRGKDSVTVKTARAEKHEDRLSIEYPGRILAASDVNLSFRVAGPILSVLPEEGAFVKKGQLIAEIDPRDYEIQLHRRVHHPSETRLQPVQHHELPGPDERLSGTGQKGLFQLR